MTRNCNQHATRPKACGTELSTAATSTADADERWDASVCVSVSLCMCVCVYTYLVIIEIKLPLIESEMVNKIACRQLFCILALIAPAVGSLYLYLYLCSQIVWPLNLHIYTSCIYIYRLAKIWNFFVFNFKQMQIELIVVISLRSAIA